MSTCCCDTFLVMVKIELKIPLETHLGANLKLELILESFYLKHKKQQELLKTFERKPVY